MLRPEECSRSSRESIAITSDAAALVTSPATNHELRITPQHSTIQDRNAVVLLLNELMEFVLLDA
jgi:hypothetical protein